MSMTFLMVCTFNKVQIYRMSNERQHLLAMLTLAAAGLMQLFRHKSSSHACRIWTAFMARGL